MSRSIRPIRKAGQPTDSSLVRLQKVLARAGHGSRRRCEEFILSGRVTVDDRPVTKLGTRVDPSRQQILLDGEPVVAEQRSYYLLNKPPGYLCTHRDPAGRRRVIDLFPQDREQLFTVGRLDDHSQGLLLVTNDGELANRLAHPRYAVPRTYEAQVAGIPTQQTLQKLRTGLHFADGTFRVDRIRRLRTKGKSTLLEIVLSQGRNREIRRMLARLGHKVMVLKRVAFGPLKLGRIPPGRYRPLKPRELKQLRELIAPEGSKTTPPLRRQKLKQRGRR